MKNIIFQGLEDNSQVWMSHGDSILRLPESSQIIGSTDDVEIAAFSLNAEYTFAGKTGTAQIIGIDQESEYKEEEIPDDLKDHALFIAFAPVEQPEIAVAIIVENGGGGSKTAAPISRKMFDNYFLNKSISKNE